MSLYLCNENKEHIIEMSKSIPIIIGPVLFILIIISLNHASISYYCGAQKDNHGNVK